MKVSKLIKELKYWKKTYGDREVDIQDMSADDMRMIQLSDVCATVTGEDEDDNVNITLISYKEVGKLTIEDQEDQMTRLRGEMYDDLHRLLLGEKLPCDINTKEGVLIPKNKKLTRRLLLRLIKYKDLLTKIEHKPLRKHLSRVLKKYENLDFYDVPYWTKKSKPLR